MRPFLQALLLTLLFGATAQAWAQPGWSPPPSPCDTLRPINLRWRMDTVVTDPLLARMVGSIDSAVGAMPGLEKLWKTQLRTMMLDSKAMRCPDKGFVAVDLPEVTHAAIAIQAHGFLLQTLVYQNGALLSQHVLQRKWEQAPSQAVWEEEILDHEAHTIFRRKSSFGTGIVTTAITVADDRVVQIDYAREGDRVGLQYVYQDGKDILRYKEPGSHTMWTLNLDRPEDQAIWQREGKAFYDHAFNFYVRLPEPLLAFGTPAARTMTYRNPFKD